MATQQEVIKKFMKSLDTTSKKGEAAINAAIKSASSSTFSTFKELKKALIKDCKNAKSGDDFLKTYCGINLDNDDTGAITGSDAGGSTIKTAESIVPESGSLDTSFKENSFTVNRLMVKLGTNNGSRSNPNTSARDATKLGEEEEYLWQSLHSYWIAGGLDLISESYGSNFSFLKSKSSTDKTKPTTKTLWVVFEDTGDDGERASTWGGPYNSQKSTMDIELYVNLNYYKNASGKDGAVTNNINLDRTIAHELTHAVMRANIDYFDYLPAFVKEGTAELTHGIDDDRTYSIKKLGDNSSLLSQALVMETSANKVNVSGVNSPSYAGGYMFMRYLARQMGDLTVENTTDSSVQTFYGNDHVKNFVSDANIVTGAGKDTVEVGSDAKKVTIDSGSHNDYINNWGASARITTGSGNDTVHNSSLASGSYIDTGSGNDSISSFGNSVKIISGSGNDTIWNGINSNEVGGSKVTVDGGSGADFIVNWGGAASMVGGSGNDSIWGGTGKDTLKGDAGNDKLIGNAGNDKLYGNAGNDTLWGEAGNDSLWGGAGNDFLYGGDGKDVFIYKPGEGTDKIFDYSSGDMLQILKSNGKTGGTFKSAKYSGGDFLFT